MRLDLLYDVDVMIFGAPSGAVAAALAAKKAGATVLAVSDRSYFGEETAGAMRLWPRVCSDHPLFIAAFGTGAAVGPPTPLRIKRVLDQALLEAEVPVLCDCRPAFLLQGEKGELAGAVLAYRTQLCAVRAKVLVDCSHTGLLVRLAELPIAERPVGADRQLVVLGAAPPADRQGHWQEAPMPLSLHTAQGEKVYQAYILRVPPGSPLCAFGQAGAEACSAGASASWVTAALEREFLDRRRLHYPGILYSADTFYDPMLVGLAVQEEATDDFCSLPDEALSHCQGRLMVANGLLPLTAAAAAELDEFANQLALGERAGRLAAVAAAGLKTVSGPYSCSSASTGAGEQSGEPESPAGAGKRELRFDKFFRREPGPHAGGDMELEVEIGDIPLLAEADVVVAGGGTSGAAAGIAAARAGARTILLERLHAPGGVGTLGLITKYWFGNRVGFTAEIDEGVSAYSKKPTGDPAHWFPEDKIGWYFSALHTAGTKVWLGCSACGVVMEGDTVTGLLVSTPYGTAMIAAKAVIDATGNADIAASAGAPCRVIDEFHVAVQGTGLPPRRPDLSYRNSDHNFIDDTDAVGVTHAYFHARAKFAGEFDVAPLVDSRERRQICGVFEVTPLDLLANRTYDDTVLEAASNFDTHGFTVHPVFVVKAPDRTLLRAKVPFRSLLPQRVRRLLVTGLGMSAHRDALPVLRMQADLQNQGYAAGLAAAMAAAGEVDYRELDIRRLQAALVEVGILSREVLTERESFPLDAAVVRRATAEGPIDLFNTAVILGHREISLPLLLDILENSSDPLKREDAALLLGLCGRPEAAPALAEIVAARRWDKGWNYTGMGQFGMSMSRLDALIIALGKTLSPLGIAPLLQRIEELDAGSEFSHCRAVSIAAAALNDRRLARALYDLLQKPGLRGHAHLSTAAVARQANSRLDETEARNAALKELLLARGLYLCGDHEGLGRSILETYAVDLRGHFARHAQAVLACRHVALLRREVM